MIALTGGKTGGHIIPLIAIAKELGNEVIYIGGMGLLEERICKKNNIDFIGIKLTNSKIKTLIKAYYELKRKIKVEITAIVSSGGYISFPLLLYGIIKKIPIFLLEENVIIGSSNKCFALFAKKVFLSYPLPKMKSKYLVVGQPLLKPNLSYLKYSQYNFDVLIIGGSLGSRPLCKLALKLSSKYKVGLVCGRYVNEYKSDKYVCFEYVDDLLNLMLTSKIIISRAGAQTTAEIFYINKPCILVPSMKTKKNHQFLNAKYFENKKCCLVVLEENLEKDIFYNIDLLLNNENIIINMKEEQKKLINEDSAKLIVNEIKGGNL